MLPMINESDPPIKRARGFCSYVMHRKSGYRDCCKTLCNCIKATCGGCNEMDNFVMEAEKIIKQYFGNAVEIRHNPNASA